jgi:hypothetical protein
VIHLAARLHAFVHGLFRPGDEAITRELYGKVEALFRRHGLGDQDGRIDLAVSLAEEVFGRCNREGDEWDVDTLAKLVLRLLDYEEMFLLPRIDWSDRHSVSEYWAIRDQLNAQRAWLEEFDQTRELLTLALCHCCDAIWQADPTPTRGGAAGDGITVPTPRIRAMAELPQVVEAIAGTIFAEDLEKAGELARHRDRFERNLVAASGGNPADPKSFNRQPKLPTKSDIRDPAELVETYLGGTPLSDLFEGNIDVVIPTETRFEHHHIIAGSGHGKTQTLQYLIAEDLAAVAAGKRSVIVLDSQGDLIRNISQLKQFGPGEALHDRIVIIDPTDVEYPVSLNLFDVGLERLDRYSQLDRERLTNSILELYDFVLGSLLAAEMTQKQSVIFRYVTRLMLHIPDATIHTLRELMEPHSEIKFAGDIAKLQGTARHFFETEFASKEFEQTKRQVLRRLWGILENQSFERMFSHPRSKLDLFSEMNAGKVILINTAKDLLKEQGTEIFGRFFIALIAQAAQERATLPEARRMPTFVYIDEAADYFDRNIGIILSQARKYNVGMVLAHQYLGQLEPKLQDAFAANTSIKFAGGVSNKDARALAPMLGCEPGLIEAQPKLSFAASIRGTTKAALPLQFPYGHLEALPRMSDEEWHALRDAMRARYAVHYSELGQTQEKSKEDDSDDEVDATEDGMDAEAQDDEPADTERLGKGSAGVSTAGPDDLDHADTSTSPKL